MDPRKCMIIDTSKKESSKMFITSQVAHLELTNGMWHITFVTTPLRYTYRAERIKYLNDPEQLNVEEHGLYIHGIHIDSVQELYKFTDNNSTFYHVVYSNGKIADFKGYDVYVSRTTLDQCGGGTWKYLRHLAAEFGLQLPQVGNVLSMQYDTVDRNRDNTPLALFLGERPAQQKFRLPNTVIYPFGCNASQKLGVERALSNKISIIQGPPGTGKTQTILNIVANLLMLNKTVLVVSNNNSAVANVAEKLSSEEVGLGFLVAQLGRKEQKEDFIAHQPGLPNLLHWKCPDYLSLKVAVQKQVELVSQGFAQETKCKQLRLELDALKTESHYEAMRATDIPPQYAWLEHETSSCLLALKCQYDTLIDARKKINWFHYIQWIWHLGFKGWSFLHQSQTLIQAWIESAYYTSRRRELEAEIGDAESFLNSHKMDKNVQALRTTSLALLKHHIASQRKNARRPIFTLEEIKSQTSNFLLEYPVVLSTTYAAKNCINKNMVFDYVIMDEASQVDITTGALALSCAMNAVIVGDDKQLPNVLDDKTRIGMTVLEKTYDVDAKYCCTTHSFLQSCCEVFTEAPQTLLREHYRCHPKIIEFCNQRFYDGMLIPMTKDKDEKDVLNIIRTVKGRHARDHYNQREIDVLKEEVIPFLKQKDSVGIITPYREQAKEINKQLETNIASTVHKYQGRECNHIILSMVDNQVTSFSDDPNLLNVAISRAKDQLTVVVTGNGLDEDCNMSQLIAYANYHNFRVGESKIHSVFDLLYRPYTEQRLAFEKKGKVVKELSENLIYHTLKDALQQMKEHQLDILCHYPLNRLIADASCLTEEECSFADNAFAHVDFLLYQPLTKRPMLVLEVDGWSYHQIPVQEARDRIKDGILAKIGLQIIRLSTVQTVTMETISSLLQNSISKPMC